MDYITPERYSENVDARCSKDWHFGTVLGPVFAQVLVDLGREAQKLDAYKKTIFYNKPLDLGTHMRQQLFAARYDDITFGILGTVHPGGPDAESDSNKEVVIEFSLQQQMMLHAIIGIATEAGELIESFVSSMANIQRNEVKIDDAFDHVNLREEAGDVLWYVQLLLNAIGSNIPECMTINDNKLEKRYGPAFSSDRANNRDLDGEREVLEDNNG